MAPDPAKKLAFEILSHVDPNVVGTRLGRLTMKGRQDLMTPNFFAISSRGVIPHITPDIISAETQISGVHMALEDCESSSMITCSIS
jgi:queuine tRNA-ribosyltransferase